MERMSARRAAGLPVTVTALRAEHLRESLGIGVARPRLSWQLVTERPAWRQAAYQLEAVRADGGSHSVARKVRSRESVLVRWPFAPLAARERVSVRVRVWGRDGSVSGWSEALCVEAGLLDASDWSARFITPGWDEDTSRPQPCTLLRRDFAVHPGLARARLYVTALGLYEARINDEIVGDHVLSPGWTSYAHRLPYQTFDVTAMLREGPNALGAMLADGWYRGRLGYNGGRRNIYGDRLALLAQLEMVYADGSREIVATDASWRAARGPVLASGIYDGETYDAGLERTGWAAPGLDDAAWNVVRLLARETTGLVAPSGPPLRRTQLVKPTSLTRSPSGRWIVDFGQNIAGRVRCTVQGPAGTTITLRHAEVLEDGELCIRPLRTAAATDRYTLRGGAPETWEPRFTYHGFRYVEIDGWPGEPTPRDLLAVVCHSDLERTGWFKCSDPLLTQLHENIVWSMRGNFVGLPTDCPQRDERLGWTGDIQAFAPTACFLYDAAGLLGSWLADLALEQDASGAVPFFVPNINLGPVVPAAGWGDAAVVVPWVLYERFADPGILAAQFDSMCAWVDHVAGRAGKRGLWDTGFQFGDWLDPAAPPERPGDARTDSALLATAWAARSARIVSCAAQVLGRGREERRYGSLERRFRRAFTREFVSASGRVASDTATAYAVALQFGLFPRAVQRHRAGERLAQIIRENGYRISTGFMGTPLVCDALCAAGEEHTAFRLLTQRACPSWLYPVTMGATTIWERWDSMLPDGSVNPGDMTSFNHYALGAVADWIHRAVGGLAPAQPGYRAIEFRPLPGGGLTSAQVRHITPCGPAECSWRLRNGDIVVEVTVPPNSTGTVVLPGTSAPPLRVGSGTHRWSRPYAPPPSPPLTLESTLSELFADPAAWAEVERSLPELACLPTITQISSGTTLRQQLGFLPNGESLVPALGRILRKIAGGRS